MEFQFSRSHKMMQKKDSRDSDNDTLTFVEFREDSKKYEANSKQTIKNYLKASINNDFKPEKN